MARKVNVFQTPAREKLKSDLEAKLADTPRMVRINFDVPESLRNRFKAKCAAEGVQMNEVMQALLRSYLEE